MPSLAAALTWLEGTIFVVTLLALRRQAVVDALTCYNYTSTKSSELPWNAPVVSGCRSCSRAVYAAQWPSRPNAALPSVYTWTCSNLAVQLPSVRPSYGSNYPSGEECAMGAHELASPSAGYLALCTCCTDYCNAALTCKTYPSTSVSGETRIRYVDYVDARSTAVTYFQRGHSSLNATGLAAVILVLSIINYRRAANSLVD